jgi:hypothetical protein
MNKIVVSVENHNCVFKKIKENDEEIIFYNTDYFKRIGFPDVEVIIGSTIDAHMKGGYYDKPEELTFPFRHLVYLVQGTGKRKPLKKTQEQQQPPPTQSESNNLPNFFDRLVTYGKEASNIISTGIQKVEPYFKQQPQVPTPEKSENNTASETQENPSEISPVGPTPEIQEKPSEISPVGPTPEIQEKPSEISPASTTPEIQEKPSEISPASTTPEIQEKPSEISPASTTPEIQENPSEISPAGPTPEQTQDNPIQYYKITIPINKPISKVPLGKYEKEELLLDFLLLDNKVEKSLGKSKSGKIYKVGTRYIRMCEEVKEWSPLKIKQNPLIGTKMHKFGKLVNGSVINFKV